LVQVHVENVEFAGPRFRINELIGEIGRLVSRLASPALRNDIRAAAPRAKEGLLKQIGRLKHELDLLEQRLQARAAKPPAPSQEPAQTKPKDAPVKKRD
jgi:hypothetical protein